MIGAAVIGAAPSWNTTILVCTPLVSVAVWLLVSMFRELAGEDLDEGRRGARQPLPLIVFLGLPVAVLTVLLFVRVARHDERLEGSELAVLCAATGAIALLIAIDLVREKRWRRSPQPTSN